MKTLEQLANERVLDLCERRFTGVLSEQDYRQNRREYLEQIRRQIMMVPIVERESQWALSQPRSLFILFICAVISVYSSIILLPSATSWIFR